MGLVWTSGARGLERNRIQNWVEEAPLGGDENEKEGLPGPREERAPGGDSHSGRQKVPGALVRNDPD